jgi:hypothetical protein
VGGLGGIDRPLDVGSIPEAVHHVNPPNAIVSQLWITDCVGTIKKICQFVLRVVEGGYQIAAI